MALLDLLKFVTTGTWGTGLARPLTAAEADTNIYSLADAIQDLIDNPISGVELTNIVVSGTTVTFYMSDATTRGPFDLPIAYPRYRGEWEPLVSYAAMDIVKESVYGTYLVLLDHTSAATFDPNDGNSAGDYYVQIAPSISAAYLNTSAATLTLNSTHAGRYIRCSNASGCLVTLPSSVFDDNTEIHFRQTSTGPITIAGDSGVTLNVPSGYSSSTGSSGDTITIKHTTGDVRDVFGNLAAVSV